MDSYVCIFQMSYKKDFSRESITAEHAVVEVPTTLADAPPQFQLQMLNAGSILVTAVVLIALGGAAIAGLLKFWVVPKNTVAPNATPIN